VVVVPVDQQDVHIDAPQGACAGDPTETGAGDDDARPCSQSSG